MEAYLQGSFGQIVLGPDVVTIGCALDNRLVVNNPIASSHHAHIRPEGDGYRLTDLGSTNGTFVNEQPVNPHFPYLLQAGDRIRIGDMTFLYETGRPEFQTPFAQETGYKDTPTAKVQAIGFRAFSQSEQFGDQPPTPYFTSTQVQPISPTFEQPQTASLAMDNAHGTNMVMPPQPYESTSTQSQPSQPKSNKWLKVLLLGLAIILVLGAIGGGITTYMLTRPKPVMTVTSDFLVGLTPAGSTGTVLHISAHNFSGSSAIIFLLDNQPIASNQHITSDTNGNVKADLAITSGWAVGNHILTAKDASGYTTKVGKPVAIVEQGQAQTPGPNGAPSDDTSFSLVVTVRFQDAGTGKQMDPFSETLVITEKPDSSGGTVCQSYDDGKPNSISQTADNGVPIQITAVFSCSGTYKEGQLSYIETATSLKISSTNGVSCVARTPFVYQKLVGSFINHSIINGTASGDSVTFDCSLGINTQLNARKGSWTGQLS